MSAARVIPPVEANIPIPKLITISATGVVSPATCTIANDQPVTFKNDSSSPINVNFEADAQNIVVFNGPVQVPATSSTTVSPIYQNRTVNFNIDGSIVYPCAIQVGAGPMVVMVTYDGTQTNCTPSPVTIPVGGTLMLYKAPADPNTYDVAWPNTAKNPFTPALTTVDSASHTVNPGSPSYAFTAKLHGQLSDATGHGGGTIKVGG